MKKVSLRYAFHPFVYFFERVRSLQSTSVRRSLNLTVDVNYVWNGFPRIYYPEDPKDSQTSNFSHRCAEPRLFPKKTGEKNKSLGFFCKKTKFRIDKSFFSFAESRKFGQNLLRPPCTISNLTKFHEIQNFAKKSREPEPIPNCCMI